MSETPSSDGVLADVAVRALGPEGPFARAHADYRVREGQLGLARAISAAIESRGALIAEAGTGTGKTFAYLTPALLSGGRIIVSTGTRTLQDQLFDRDLPEVVRALGVQVECALLKGRSNYVCRYHLRRNLADGRFARREDIVDLRRIDRYAGVTRTGDRSGAPDVSEDAPAWALASSTRENCLGQECPDYGDCFVVKARQAAQKADLVVVNHHLFCADLALRDEGIADLLPTADAVIFDEAHQLPEVATSFFGSSVSTRKLTEFARDVLRAGMAEARDAADWTTESRKVEQSVRELRLHAGDPARLDAAALRTREALLNAVEQCVATLTDLREVLAASAERGRDLGRCALRAGELVLQLERWQDSVVERSTQPVSRADDDDAYGESAASPAVAGQPPAHAAAGYGAAANGAAPSAANANAADANASDANAADANAADANAADANAVYANAVYAGDAPAVAQEHSDASPVDALPVDETAADGLRVAWAEISPYGVTLHATPLSVAGTFRRHRAQRPRAWIFVSATLAVSGTFTHFARAIGMQDAATHAWESPFDFARNGLLYVPQGIGEPSGADFPQRVFDTIWPLLSANHGRAFVLCTTLRMVDQLATRLTQRLERDASDLSLLVQGTAPRAELLERFRNAAAPVLIGSASFWEGVDVRGRQLSLVVIDKLPFAPPDDPVLRARIEATRREGGDPFRQLQMPAAAMALKQGAGRMIRSETDRGLLVVCDSRLADKPYGRQLLRSLPPFTRTRSAEQALSFLAALDEPPAAPISRLATSDAGPPDSPC
ncbi:MAG TPA: ATP-dependent DNA helicase [Burkholderiaceae bacterium]|nr:ATP-dependent DNA helicase [Burkholderiaceae bacterium]